jgi:hypothetical protein
VEATLRKKERQDETQFTAKIDGFQHQNPEFVVIHKGEIKKQNLQKRTLAFNGA